MSSQLATSLASKAIAHLIAVVSELRDEALRMERRFARSIALIHPAHRVSARNLVHYLALRQRDIRPLQTQLSALGLSSLGRCESNTLAGLNAVLDMLVRLAGPIAAPGKRSLVPKPPVDFVSGPLRLERHTRRLLGRPPVHRATHIMVTMPSEAAHDAKLVEALLRSGMDIMRINGAHDDVTAWRAMVSHLNRAKKATGLQCKVLVDLAGPKLRTGALENLTKKGAPSRAEVTDAAMAVRAECVMLNKGPYVTEAVAFLDNVLRRMQDHHDKKRALLRRLSVAGGKRRRPSLSRKHGAQGQPAPISDLERAAS